MKTWKKAEEIYRQCYPHARGISRVHLCRAYLHLDTGELDTAAEDAKKGYAAAEPKQDFILMASSEKQCNAWWRTPVSTRKSKAGRTMP
jgi:hypothetical protein